MSKHFLGRYLITWDNITIDLTASITPYKRSWITNLQNNKIKICKLSYSAVINIKWRVKVYNILLNSGKIKKNKNKNAADPLFNQSFLR